MLIIKTEQLRKIDVTIKDIFIGEVKTHIEFFFPQEVNEIISKRLSVREFITTQINVANSYGIEDKKNIMIFIDFVLNYEKEFSEKIFWVQEILTNNLISEYKKIDLLFERLDQLETLE